MALAHDRGRRRRHGHLRLHRQAAPAAGCSDERAARPVPAQAELLPLGHPDPGRSAFFLLPLLGMLDFTTRGPVATAAVRRRGPRCWTSAGSVPTTRTSRTGIIASLLLAMLTVDRHAPAARADDDVGAAAAARAVPHAGVHLPAAAHGASDRARRRADAGLRLGGLPARRGSRCGSSFAYVILVLPYAYRALDAGLRAIDVQDPVRGSPLAWAPAGSRSCAGSCCPTCAPPCCRRRSSPSHWCSASSPSPTCFAYKNLQVAMYLLGQVRRQDRGRRRTGSRWCSPSSCCFAMSFIGSARGGISPFSRLRRPRKESA